MATLSERLAEAEAAYHDLVMGKGVTEIRDANGEMVRYTAPNRAALAGYIQDLKRQINGTVTGPMFLVI